MAGVDTITADTTGCESGGPKGERSGKVAIIFLVSRLNILILCTSPISQVLIIAGLVIAGGITVWIAVMVVLPFALLAVLLRWLFGKKNPPSDT